MCSWECVNVFDSDAAVRLGALLRPVHVTFTPAPLYKVGDHDDDNGPLLPDHPPVISKGVRERPLCGDVGSRLVVALQ